MKVFNAKKYIGIPYFVLALSMLLLVRCKEPASLSAIVISDSPENVNNYLETILENTGLFDVDIQRGAMPDFADYDVIVLSLEKADWSDQVKKDFETFVSSGGGVVVLGTSLSAFQDWPASEKLFGLPTGEGLSKSKKAYDYQIVNNKIEHPVTNGLPQKWLHGGDYMLYNTTGLKPGAEVLASARADSIYGGNNQMLPVVYALSAGEGRVFASTMGYAASIDHIEAMQCVGYITTLQRGAEWAATGVVSQEPPLDFPNSVSTHFWPTLNPLNLDEILEKAAAYEIGKSKKYLSDFSARIRNSDGKTETYAMFESKMLEFLNSNATVDSKKYMCRELSWVGSDVSIPVLEKLVNDKDLSESATYALQRLRM
jgi:type 1 glutamine amidotransferase